MTDRNEQCSEIFIVDHGGRAAFSLSRLMGELILVYELPRERAERVARDVEQVLQMVTTLTRRTEYPVDDLRFALAEVLRGRSLANVVSDQIRQRPAQGTQRRRVTRAELRTEIAGTLSGWPEYTAYLAAATTLMRLRVHAGGAREKAEALLRELYADVHDLPSAQAKRFAAIATSTAAVPPGGDLDGMIAAARKDEQETRERLFWRLVRWLATLLRDLVFEDEEDGEDPRDTPPPVVFGEVGNSGWRLRHQGAELKAIRLTEGGPFGGDDEITISGNFHYLGDQGELTPTGEIEFTHDGHHKPLNGHMFNEIAVQPQSGVYVATHILREEDLLSEENAKKVGDAIGEALGDAISEGIPELAAGAAGMAADLGSLGLLGGLAEFAVSTAMDQLLGDVLDKADEIVTDKVSKGIASALGPEKFNPLLCFVIFLWIVPGVPIWWVRHGASSRGAHPGTHPWPQFGQGRRDAGPRPGTGGPQIIVSAGTARGAYTYKFRFTVDPVGS